MFLIEYFLLGWSRSRVGVRVAVDIFRSESESLKIRQLPALARTEQGETDDASVFEAQCMALLIAELQKKNDIFGILRQNWTGDYGKKLRVLKLGRI